MTVLLESKLSFQYFGSAKQQFKQLFQQNVILYLLIALGCAEECSSSNWSRAEIAGCLKMQTPSFARVILLRLYEFLMVVSSRPTIQTYTTLNTTDI